MRVILILILSGWASQYAPGKMEEVIRVRQTPGRTNHSLPQELPEADGRIALLEPDLIGDVVLVCPHDSTLPCRTMLVVDCAGIQDGGYDWMVRNGIVAEIDYESAVAWGTVGRGIRVDILKYVTASRLNRDAR